MARMGQAGALTREHIWMIIGSGIAFLIIIVCVMMLVWKVQQKKVNFSDFFIY